jgi:hypothetical protein
MADGAAILDDLSGTVTLVARSGDTEEPLLESYLPVAIASLARGRARSLLGSTASTFRTTLVTWDFDLLCDAECGFFKRKVKVVTQIRTALHTRALAAAATEEISESENVAENVAEIGKYAWIESTHSSSAADTGVTEPVVVGAFLAIAQNGICFSGLFEGFFSFVISRISIGVVLECELSIGALDFLVAGAARHAKDFVVVSFAVQLCLFLF